MPPDLETFRQFFVQRFESAAAEIETTDRMPQALIDQCAELGAFRLTAPADIGGYGMDLSACVPYLEAAAMGPAAGRMLVHVNNGLWRPLVEFGNAAHKQLAARLASGQVCLALALTERTGGAGRDMHSRAERTSGGWRITGEKHLVTFADRAEMFIVIAATDDRRARDSLTAFVVPRSATGLVIDTTHRTMGISGAGLGRLLWQGTEVAEEGRLGQVGQGLEIALSFLAYSRLSLSACMVGLAQRALDEALRFARERTTFGKPIGSRQMMQALIAEMYADLVAARALVHSAAEASDRNADVGAIAAATKLFCAGMVGRVTDRSLRVHGGLGFTKEAPIERIYRDARGFWFEEGTQETQQIVVARHLLAMDNAP